MARSTPSVAPRAMAIATMATTSRARRVRLLVADAKFLQGFVGTSIPSSDGAIAQVLQILDADLGRPEAAGGQIAEAIEERHAMRMFRLCLRRPRNIVEHRLPLGVGAVDEDLVVALLALDVEPGQPAAHRDLPRRLVDHHEVHE